MILIVNINTVQEPAVVEQLEREIEDAVCPTAFDNPVEGLEGAESVEREGFKKCYGCFSRTMDDLAVV